MNTKTNPIVEYNAYCSMDQHYVESVQKEKKGLLGDSK